MRSILPSLLLIAAGAAHGQAEPPGRGQLLYSTHCIECHTQRMHWRDAALARDWDTLKTQVRRWQREARLDWDEDDIEAVARYLNESIYRFPRPVAMAPATPCRGARHPACR
jgi:mono/diheme cytochrome c family protein